MALRAALLLIVVTSPALGAAASGLIPQYSEDLRPAFKRAPTQDAAMLEFTAYGRDYRVRLAGNSGLARLAAGSSVELYKGALEGVPSSWARIGIQDGLPRGMIWDGSELFVLDAAPEGVNYGAAGTVMFKLSEAVLERGVSLSADAVEKPRDAAAAYGAIVEELRGNTPVMQAGVAAEGIEISILGDASYLARYSSETEAREAILIRLNNVDGIFSAQLGIGLRVASVDVSGGLAGGLSATTDSSTLLEEVGRLRQQTPALSATALTHLVTGRQFDGDAAGIAYSLALCSPRFAASVTEAHSSAALDTLIIAHEIGHVFGAPHDGAQQCAATPQGEFIMTPTLNTSITSFSQCSVDQINAVIDSYACVVTLPANEPAPPTEPDPPAGDDGGGGGDDGGSGSLDPSWLILAVLLALRAAGALHGAQRPRAARST